jgi:hypothetical protein
MQYLFLLIPVIVYGFVLWVIYTVVTSLARIGRNTEEANALLREILARQAAVTRPPTAPQ